MQNPVQTQGRDLVIRVNVSKIWSKIEPYLIIGAGIFFICLANGVVEMLTNIKIPL